MASFEQTISRIIAQCKQGTHCLVLAKSVSEVLGKLESYASVKDVDLRYVEACLFQARTYLQLLDDRRGMAALEDAHWRVARVDRLMHHRLLHASSCDTLGILETLPGDLRRLIGTSLLSTTPAITHPKIACKKKLFN